MAEGLLARITRKYRQAVLPPYQRASLAQYIPSESIGGRDVTKWAIKVLKETSRPVDLPAGSNFSAASDKFDALDANWHLHQLNKRMTMNRSERSLFEKHGILPVGIEEIASKMADEFNFIFTRGTRDGSQFNITQYNYLTDQSASSTTPQRPSLKTEAGAGAGWVVAAGEAQTDIAKLIGNLEMIGFNPSTSIFFYPEVLSAYMRMPYVNATSTYSNESIMNFILKQGIMGAVPLKNEYLPEASAGATPTKDKADVYLVDMASVVCGYTVPENINVQDNPDGLYNTYIDAEIEFCPLFKPKRYDDDGYYYKGVSRLTAIDMDA